MSQTILTLDALQNSNRVAIVDFRGTVSAAAGGALLEAFNYVRSAGSQSLVLDFSGVSGIESSGVSMLVQLCIQAKRSRVLLACAGLKDGYKDVFRLTGLDETIRLYDSRSQALLANGVAAAFQAGIGLKRFEVANGTSGDTEQGGITQWAKPTQKLHAPEIPGAISAINVEGRRPVGPLRGFGQLWEKTYEFRFPQGKARPAEIAGIMKERFVSFQPPQNHFYPSAAGIRPGEIVLISSVVMALPLYTGVLVSYADDFSFTFMTPQGHPESGWVSFRTFNESGNTVCQIQGLARANDPLYEVAFRLHGSKFQEQVWIHVMESLAKHLGVQSPVMMTRRCLDTGLQWSQAGNIRHNAQLWTLGYLALWPIRQMARMFGR